MTIRAHSLQVLRVAAAVTLIAGIIALALPPRGNDGVPVTWDALLQPASDGDALPGGYRIADVRHGGENEVLVSVSTPDGSQGVEVHILPRGCWEGVVESTTFGIAYETSHSPAPERMAVTRALAARIAARDHGLPPPDAIPLRSGFDLRTLRAALRDRSGPLLLLSTVLLLAIPFIRSRAMVLSAGAVGAVALAARASGMLFAGPGTCPTDPAIAIDLGVRVLQALWIVLVLTSPALCWRAGRASGVGGGRLLLVVSASALLALAAVWTRPDEPLHANGHAWREAREVLVPWGGRATGAAPYLHGKSAPALAWLLADAEHLATGQANPFRLSRLADAAAAGAGALLVAVLIGSAGAGLAAGATLALTPLAQMHAVSGSTLAVSAWLLPWSLGLLVVAATSGDRLLLTGAMLAGVLGSLSHTAMLGLFPALVLGWCLLAAPPWRSDRVAAIGGMCVAAAWLSELLNSFDMVASRNQGTQIGLLGAAALGLAERNLFLNPQWVSPLLVPLALLGVIAGAIRHGVGRLAVPVIALLLSAAPFFAVIQCSSDAARYQGTLLGVVTALAVIGVWELTAAARLGDVGRWGIRLALLAGLVLLPSVTSRAPADPVVVEHRLVEEAVRQMAPDTLIVLPSSTEPHVIFDFPDFLLPRGSTVTLAGDPTIASHRGPLLFYLGLACISYDERSGDLPDAMRPECRELRAQSQPRLVRALRADEVPRQTGGMPWTFHRLVTDLPFGFFTPNAENPR